MDLMDQIVFATQRTLPSNCRFKLKFLLRVCTRFRLYSVLIMFSPLGWTKFKYVTDTLYSLKISRDNVSDKEKLNDAVRYNASVYRDSSTNIDSLKIVILRSKKNS